MDKQFILGFFLIPISVHIILHYEFNMQPSLRSTEANFTLNNSVVAQNECSSADNDDLMSHSTGWSCKLDSFALYIKAEELSFFARFINF